MGNLKVTPIVIDKFRFMVYLYYRGQELSKIDEINLYYLCYLKLTF